jgi:cyclic beta-1,2-glucan synthetase
LRQLALEDWRKIFEKLSRVEQLLRRDPSGVYAKMDFDTRDRYRRAVEELARGSGQSEAQVAQRAWSSRGKLSVKRRRMNGPSTSGVI